MKKAILLLLLLPILASAQYFDVFDIDTSDYPIMKAKFYSIDANGKQILNHTPADFEITENGEQRDVISVSCPVPKDEPFSVVIAIDVSGSMGGDRIENSKKAINSFIDMLPNNGSEIAIITFNQQNYFVSDFSSVKSKLKSKVNNLIIGGGTSFDAAFLTPLAGALLVIENAKFKDKNILLVTDGVAFGNESEIINKAKNKDTRIYSIIIETSEPDILSNISSATGGETYINVITESDFDRAFVKVSNDIINGPCEITWDGKIHCENELNIEFNNKILDISLTKRMDLSENQFTAISTYESFMDIGKVPLNSYKDTSFSLMSSSHDVKVTGFTFEPQFDEFKITTPLPIIIRKGVLTKIGITFTPSDSSNLYTNLIFETDVCPIDIGIHAGFNSKPLNKRVLDILHPNGGERFVGGSDTIINWKGVSRSENVLLEFSSDNGANWSVISDSASGLSENWNVPNFKSENCLVRVSSFSSKDDLPLKQQGDLLWERSLGGGYEEFASSVVNGDNDSYIVVGMFESYDKFIDRANYQRDMWVIKLSKEGVILWDKKFHKRSEDYATSIKKIKNRSYVILGYSESSGMSSYNYQLIWVTKIDEEGNLVWDKFFGNKGYSYGNEIQVTQDGGYIITGMEQVNENGRLHNECVVIKIDETGNQEWLRTYGGTWHEVGNSITQTVDGNYLVVGGTMSVNGDIPINKGSEDLFIINLNKEGDIIWVKTFGGTRTDAATSIVGTYDGGFIVTGYTNSIGDDIPYNKGEYDCWVLKFDKDGIIQWNNTYGGERSDYGKSIKQTKDGGFIVSGYSTSREGDIVSNKGAEDFWMFKLRNNGDLEWSKSFGGNSRDQAREIIETTDGNYIAVGKTLSDNGDITDGNESSNIWVVKIAGNISPLQSDTSDAVFSIIMPEPVIKNNDIDMGQMIVGSTKDSTVLSVICNVGDAPLHVLGVDITGGNATNDFLIPRGAGDFFLNKGECRDFMIEFTPSALGNRTAVATIRTTIGDFTDTIRIRGVGINPVIEATADVVDFGVFELGNGKDTTVVLVKNVGSNPITITDTRISGPDMEQFTLNTTPVTYTIAAGQEETFELNYTAKYGGRTSSILEFHYNGIGSPLRSMLFAEGIGGEVYPQVPDAYVGETVELGIFLGKIKPEGLSEVATNYTATVSYNSTLLAPIDKSMTITTEDNKSFIQIAGKLSGVSQIAAVPMKVGLGTAIKSGLVITEFQLYDAKGDSVDYEIEPGVGEFNVLGICEEGGTRLLNPNGDATLLKVLPNRTSNQTTVEMKLIESGPTELTIFDQIGNKIATVYSGNPEIGTKEIPLDLSQYANGRYYIKLTTPTITKTEILEVVR